MKLAKSIVYVTRDAERALGMDQDENYAIISNEKGEKLDTYELLQSSRMEKFMADRENSSILVFQNTARIEKFCAEKKWKLLNPEAELSKKIEEKISQYEWLGDLRKFLPKTEIKKMSEVRFAGKSLVVQFNHAHTGLGTHIVSDDKELRALSEKFPDRPTRISDFIQGPVFTLNIVVAKNGVFCGNISYQITGLPNFTDNPFSTVGNDWKLPETLLSKKDKEKILEIAGKTGEKMKNAGWLGLFGIDVIMNEKSHEIFLLEINARQPASTTCESFLQKSAGKNMTIFEAHILALLGEKINDMQKISDGAQIVVRVKAGQKQSDLRARSLSEAHKRENRSVSARLISEGFAVTEYENTEPNKDLLRIRSEKGIMESHGKMNAVGEKISSLIFKS